MGEGEQQHPIGSGATGSDSAERDKFRALFDHAQDAIFICDAQGRFVDVNPAACQRLQYTREELLGMTPQDIDAPEHAARVAGRLAELQVRGSLVFESVHRRRDGTLFPVEVSVQTIRHGGETLLLSICRDLTERQQAAAAVCESEARYRTLFDSSRDALMTLAPPDWRFTACNAAAVRLYGVADEAEFTAAGPWELSPDRQPDGRPSAEKAREMIEIAMRTGSHFFEWTHRRLGAGEFPATVLLTRIEFQGQILLQATVRDITEHKQAEQRAAAALNYNQLLLQASPIGIITYRATGEAVSANPAAVRMIGAPLEQLTAQNFRQLESWQRSGLLAAADSALSTGEAKTVELQHRTTFGNDLWLSAQFVPFEHEGKPQLLGLFVDITERQRAEAELRRLTLFNQETLDALTAHICVLDADGTIIAVNKAWREFAAANPPIRGEVGVGANYLAVCDAATGDDAPSAKAMARGIRAVARGETSQFTHEYPCHSPDQQRWFLARVTRLREEGPARVVIFHANLTERKLAEQALRESEMKFATVFHDAPVLIAITDAASEVYVDVNEEALRVSGYARGEVIGRTSTELGWITAGERDRFMGELQKHGRIAGLEMTFHTKRGDRLVGLLNGEMILLGGRPCLLTVAADVTARKQAEAALARDEAELAAIYHSSPIMMVLLDADRRVRRLNREALEFTGKPEAEVLGTRGGDLLGCVHAADDPRGCGFGPDCGTCPLRLAIQDTVATGASHRRVETRPSLVRGEETRDYTMLASTSRMLVDGEPMVLLCLEDISLQKHAEARVHQQAALLDQIQDAVLVLGLDRRFHYANRSAEMLYGMNGSALLSQKVETLLFPGRPAHFAEVCQTTLERGAWAGEVRLVSALGTRRVVSSRWTLIRDMTGRPASFLVLNMDVTEAKRLEEQFLRAQRMESIGTLASGVAHDLNNILAPILMATEVLRPLARKPDEAEVLDMLKKAAERGADIIRQLLTFGRGVEGQRMDLQPRSLLKEMMKVIRETFPKTITLKHHFPDNLWMIHADPTHVHQVLLNLCVNARDAMPQGGQMTLAAENLVMDEDYAAMNIEAKPGPYVVLEVGDTGTGIAPEIMDKIFDPFFTTKEQGKGTGLGLSTVLGIVKSHGGFTQVSSRLRKGTHFKVYFPALEGPKAPPAAKSAARPPRGHGELILVVDDEESIRVVAERMLTRAGYRVVTATDGADGVVTFSQHQRDISAVVADMMMPVMDGATMIRSLRHLWPGLPIIAMSGLPAQQGEAEKAGVAEGAFLAKPFTPESLLILLHKMLGDRKAK